MAPERFTILYSGSVQGVGFRYTATNIARKKAVKGFVRNLPDGRVELVAEGDEPEVNSLISEIENAMAGYIAKTVVKKTQATGEFSSFHINH